MAKSGKRATSAAPEEGARKPRPLLVNLDPERRTVLVPAGVDPPEDLADLPRQTLPLAGLPEYQGKDFGFVVRPVTADVEARAASEAFRLGDNGRKVEVDESQANARKFLHAVVSWFGIDHQTPEGNVVELPVDEKHVLAFFKIHAELAARVILGSKRAQVQADARTASAAGN